jgi:glycopeptide antibiotics resistance protein
MRRTKPIASLLWLYIPILLVGLLLPRDTSIDCEPMGMLKRIFHEILFLSGPPEVFLNFLLFIPFFFALLFLVSTLSRPWAALISCLTSAAAELAQTQISGRVSSLQDFVSNCVGVLITLALVSAPSVRKKAE